MKARPIEELRIPLERGSISALLLLPDQARHLLVLAHGAGAGMRHDFMEAIAAALAAQGMGSLRYQFPYMEARGGRPDPAPILVATVRAAVRVARERCPELPLVAGGKSMGGRMTTLAASEEPLDGVTGIVLIGFPLHPAGLPSTKRGEHLARVNVPMLFLQGTRDALADLTLIRGVTTGLGPRAMLRVVEGADHAFHVLKRSGRSDQDVLAELARETTTWVPGSPRGPQPPV